MFYGLLIGALSFVIIGVFHPIVIKSEHYFTKKCWPVFLVSGLGFCAGSCFVKSIVVSCILAMIGFSCLWSIIEVFEQEERVRKGWFPAHPKHAHKYKKIDVEKKEEEKPASEATTEESK